MTMKEGGNNGDIFALKVLKSKPTEWPFWAWILIAAVFGTPTLLSIFGLNVPSVEDIASTDRVSRSVAVNLVAAQQKTTEAIDILKEEYQDHTEEYTEYRARSEERMIALEKNIETLRQDLRELRKGL